ncbi:hypothetical protein V6Z12_A03G074100 [Gossypium hirsutum]
MRFYTCTRDDIDTVFSMVERLEHGDERRASITFFVNTGAIVMELNDMIMVHFSYFIHDALEPIKRALFPCYPIKGHPLSIKGGL